VLFYSATERLGFYEKIGYLGFCNRTNYLRFKECEEIRLSEHKKNASHRQPTPQILA
jgi:hypothetical protein